MKAPLNHYSAAILPYYIDDDNKLWFLFEQKDSSYKPPYFDNALTFFGGNFQKNINPDRSPEETLDREIKEEFFIIDEPNDSLSELFNDDSFKSMSNKNLKHDKETIEKIKIIGKIILDKKQHVADYIITVSPPITKEILNYGASIFIKKLSKKEFDYISDILKELDYKVTSENLKFDARTVLKRFDDIKLNTKFSWAYDLILEDLIKIKFPLLKENIIITSSLLEIKRFYPKNINDNGKKFDYKDIEDLGYEFKSSFRIN